MARANCNSFLVEDGSDIGRVNAFDHEGKYTGPLPCSTDHSHSWNLDEPSGGIVQQFVLVCGDIFHSEPVQIFDCHTQPDRTSNIGRTRFKLEWQLVVSRLLERHRADHVSAALERGHLLQQSGFAVQDANSGGAVHLVSGKGVEVTVQSLHVDFKMGHSLCTIDQYRNTFLVCQLYNLADRIQGPKRIRDVCDRDDLCAGCEECFKLGKQQLATIIDGSDPQLCASFLAQNLPGHDVRMMLHGGDQHFIATLNMSAAIGLGHQVNRFRCTPNEDDFTHLRGIHKPLHRPASLLVLFGRV